MWVPVSWSHKPFFLGGGLVLKWPSLVGLLLMDRTTQLYNCTLCVCVCVCVHVHVCVFSHGRTAYLPDNPDGRQILKLFQTAWERKLLFTVGRSVTTGRDNTVNISQSFIIHQHITHSLTHATQTNKQTCNWQETYFLSCSCVCVCVGQVVWAGIHHKTCTHGGATNFGYPDETYFSRGTLSSLSHVLYCSILLLRSSSS